MNDHHDAAQLPRQAAAPTPAEPDSRHLAQVAVGRGSQLDGDAIERLISAGLVRRPPHRLPGAPELELTAAGLARIRSSDQ